jgi:competence protein ComEA
VVTLRTALRDRPVIRVGVVASVIVVPAAIGALLTSRGSDQPTPAAIPAVAAPAPAATLLVYVSGAVVHPGLYELAVGARVADAIAAAGGMLATADRGRLPDMAALTHDGHQVNVPFAKGAAAPTSVKVDANTATAAELADIPGMTIDVAQAIVDTRTMWGPYANLSDLRAALGLDTATAALLGKHLAFLTTLP